MLQNQNGVALITVILSLTILLVLIITLLSLSQNSFQMTQAEKRYQAAYYLAEAGFRHQIEHMKLRVETLSQGNTTASAFFNNFTHLSRHIAIPLRVEKFGADNAAVVTQSMAALQSSGNPRSFTFDSSANIGNVKRTIRGRVTIRWGILQPAMTLFEYAIFANSGIILESNSTVEGSIATNAEENNSVKIYSGAILNGDYFSFLGNQEAVLDMENRDSLTGSFLALSQRITLPQIRNPEGFIENGRFSLGYGEKYTISESGDFSDFELFKGSELLIDASKDDILINVDNLNIDSSYLRIIGRGRVVFFVDGLTKIINHSNINRFDETNNFINSSNLVIMTNGDNVLISGLETKINAAIYAPRAFVEILDGANVFGSIIAETIILQGNVTYNKDYLGDFSDFLATQSGFIRPEEIFRIDSWGEFR